MSYLDKHLLENEKILYRTQLHWVVFLWPLILALLAVIFMLQMSVLSIMGYIFLVAAGVMWVQATVAYYTTEFGLTNKRVLLKMGFIQRSSLEILLSKIESIQVYQSILGRFLNYGTVIISGTGGSKDPFTRIADPFVFRRKVQEQLERGTISVSQ